MDKKEKRRAASRLRSRGHSENTYWFPFPQCENRRGRKNLPPTKSRYLEGSPSRRFMDFHRKYDSRARAFRKNMFSARELSVRGFRYTIIINVQVSRYRYKMRTVYEHVGVIKDRGRRGNERVTDCIYGLYRCWADGDHLDVAYDGFRNILISRHTGVFFRLIFRAIVQS